MKLNPLLSSPIRSQSSAKDKDEAPLSPSEAHRRNEFLLSKIMRDFEEAKAKGLIKDGFEDFDEIGEEGDEAEWVVWRADGDESAASNASSDKSKDLVESLASKTVVSSSVPKVEVMDVFPSLPSLQTEDGGSVNLNEILKTRGLFLFSYHRATLLPVLKYPWEEILAKGFEIYGIGPESIQLQAKWKAKFKFKHSMICDSNWTALEKLGLLNSKDEGFTAVRSHMIVDKGGQVLLFEKKVTPKKGVRRVIEFFNLESKPDDTI